MNSTGTALTGIYQHAGLGEMEDVGNRYKKKGRQLPFIAVLYVANLLLVQDVWDLCLDFVTLLDGRDHDIIVWRYMCHNIRHVTKSDTPQYQIRHNIRRVAISDRSQYQTRHNIRHTTISDTSQHRTCCNIRHIISHVMISYWWAGNEK